MEGREGGMKEQVVLPFVRSVVSLKGNNNADVDVHCLCLSFHSSFAGVCAGGYI